MEKLTTQLQSQTFHHSISKVLYISQIFALLPVTNLLSTDIYDMCYSWLSIQTIYAILILVLNGLEFVTAVNFVLKQGLNFHTSGTVSFFTVCLLEHLFFWRLAIKWPFIMQTWRQTEEIFLRAPYRLYVTHNMKIRIYVLTFIVMLCAFVEHGLLVFNSFQKSELERKQCKLNISTWESLYRRERPHVSLVVPFNIWLLPVLEWTNLTLAYPRSFTDAFIICVSIGLSTRFKQLHLRIDAVHKKAMPALFWTEAREHYLMLKQLVDLLNINISTIIVLAFSNNMYFICFQLFNSFQNLGVDFYAAIAFWYSLLFAIARTLLTLFIASTVNDYNAKILRTLRDVPSKSWCMEIQRFSEQLALDLTALSGNGFFFLTRKLILAMASTIVTYELMVTDVINKGAIQQKTDYCQHYEN